jgi:hypothetical protein
MRRPGMKAIEAGPVSAAFREPAAEHLVLGVDCMHQDLE